LRIGKEIFHQITLALRGSSETTRRRGGRGRGGAAGDASGDSS